MALFIYIYFCVEQYRVVARKIPTCNVSHCSPRETKTVSYNRDTNLERFDGCDCKRKGRIDKWLVDTLSLPDRAWSRYTASLFDVHNVCLVSWRQIETLCRHMKELEMLLVGVRAFRRESYNAVDVTFVKFF